MANKYWVGGSGFWATNMTANWSLTSGGAGGAATPTATDDVIFDSNSGTGSYTIYSSFTRTATITIASPAVVTVATSGAPATNSPVMFSTTGALPTGLTPGVIYYAINLTTTTFQVAATPNGAAINTSGTQSGTHTVAGTTAGTAPTQPASITINNPTTTGNTATINVLSSTLGVQNNTAVAFTQTSTTGSFAVTGVGTFALGCGVTINSPSRMSFSVATITNPASVGAPNWNFGGCSMTSDLTMSGTFGFALGGNLTTSGLLTSPISTGNITVTGYTLSVGAYIGNTVIACGSTGTFNITGDGSVVNTGTANEIFRSQGSAFDITGTAGALNLTGGGSAARQITQNSAANPVTLNVSSGTFSLTINTAAQFKDINFTGFSGTWAGNANTCGLTGTLTLSPTMTVATGTGNVNFKAPTATTRTHQFNGVTFNRPVLVTGDTNTAVWTVPSSLALGSSFELAQGKVDITNLTLTTTDLTISGAGAKIVAFGTTGSFYLTSPGVGGNIFTNTGASAYTYTGTSNVTINTSGSGTKTVNSSTATATTAYNFYFTGGTYTMAVTTSSVFNDFVTTGSSPAVSNNAFSIAGNFTIGSTTTFTSTSQTLTFIATSAKTITTNGVTINRTLTFDGSGGSWQLQDSFTTINLTTLTNGTLNLNGKMLTTQSFNTGAGTKNLTFNGGSITATGVTCFNNANPTNFTTTAGVANGFMYASYAAGAKTFVGGGSTFAATLVQTTNATGALTISGTNTRFSGIKNTTQPTVIAFTSAQTFFFTDSFSLKGTGGALVQILSTASGSGATVSKTAASGNVSCDYLLIKDNLPAGGASWYAGPHSTLVSNYTGVNGWYLRPPPTANAEFLSMFMPV